MDLALALFASMMLLTVDFETADFSKKTGLEKQVACNYEPRLHLTALRLLLILLIKSTN